MFVAHTHTHTYDNRACATIYIIYTAEGFAISNTLHNKNKLFSTCMIPHVVSVDNTNFHLAIWHHIMGVWIRWNGVVEWNGGMDYWNGILEYPTYYRAVLKSTVAERTSTERRGGLDFL